jgi:hypothetical protein
VAARSREKEAVPRAYPLFFSGSPRRSGDTESLLSILLPAFRAGRGVGVNSLLLLEWLWSVIDSSASMRLSLPFLLVVAARGEEEGASSGAVLEVALFRALSGQAFPWQTSCCSAVPFIYACLLPPVAGAGVLMAGPSSPSAVVELFSLHHLSGFAGVGSPPYRALP